MSKVEKLYKKEDNENFIFITKNKNFNTNKYFRSEEEDRDFSYSLLSKDFYSIEEKSEFNIFPTEEDITIAELYVTQQDRGLGLSKSLLTKSIEIAKNKGIKKIYLYASELWRGTPFNILKKIYEGVGFVQYKNTPVFVFKVS